MKDLEIAYANAYKEKDPQQMKQHLVTFEDCVWLYEYSVGIFKEAAIESASDKISSFAEFWWVMKHTYKYILIEKNLNKIRETRNEIRREWKELQSRRGY